MKKTTLVSIVVPVYKVERYLRNCVDSVLMQTYTSWELILVDDGSPDKCGEICDEYQRFDNRVKVIHKANGGQAQARNRALDICEGDYVMFLDSDDFLHPDCVEYLVNTAIKTKADIVQCGFIRGSDTAFPTIKMIDTEEVFDNKSIFLEGKANVIVWGKLYRREIVHTTRIKEGKYYEDDFTTWRWYYHAKKIVVSNKVLYYYSLNPTSTMAQHHKKPSLDFLDAYRERIYFFQKRGEKDLEDCSRLQLCKSVVLSYGSPKLSHDEKRILRTSFDDSWREIKESPYIRRQYKLLFILFITMPAITSRLAAKLRNNK